MACEDHRGIGRQQGKQGSVPVREIISASHILTDLTLAPATLVYDYLAEQNDHPDKEK